MVVVQPQRCVRLGLLLVPFLGFCLSIEVTAKEEQELPPQKGADRANEIKALLKERHSTLSELLKNLTAQYRNGTVDFSRVAQAERDFLKATVDLEENPEKRLAALKSVRDTANIVVELAEARFKAGQVSTADVLQARALLLEAKIELLREELKSQPGK